MSTYKLFMGGQVKYIEDEIKSLPPYIEDLRKCCKLVEDEVKMAIDMQYWGDAFAEREVREELFWNKDDIEKILVADINMAVQQFSGVTQSVKVYHAYMAALKRAAELEKQLARDLLATRKEYTHVRKEEKKERNKKPCA